PDLEEGFFRRNTSNMLGEANKLITPLVSVEDAGDLLYLGLALEARQSFLAYYMDLYVEHLRNHFKDRNEVGSQFYLKANLRAIPIILLVFDEAMELSMQLRSDMGLMP